MQSEKRYRLAPKVRYQGIRKPGQTYIANEIFDDTRLQISHQMIFARLSLLDNTGGIAFTFTEIQAASQRRPKIVKRALAELIKCGYVEEVTP